MPGELGKPNLAEISFSEHLFELGTRAWPQNFTTPDQVCQEKTPISTISSQNPKILNLDRSPTFYYRSPMHSAQTAFSGILSVVEMQYMETPQHAGNNVGMHAPTGRPRGKGNVAKVYLKNRTFVSFSAVEWWSEHLFVEHLFVFAHRTPQALYTPSIHRNGVYGAHPEKFRVYGVSSLPLYTAPIPRF